MKILRDGHARMTGLLLNGSELQLVIDSKLMNRAKSYTIAQEGSEYRVKATELILERIINYLSME